MKSILKYPDCAVRDGRMEALDGRFNLGEILVSDAMTEDTCSLVRGEFFT